MESLVIELRGAWVELRDAWAELRDARVELRDDWVELTIDWRGVKVGVVIGSVSVNDDATPPSELLSRLVTVREEEEEGEEG